MSTSSPIPAYVRERVYRRWGFDAQRFAILGYRDHWVVLLNPTLDRPYTLVDLDDGATVATFTEPEQATAALDRLAPAPAEPSSRELDLVARQLRDLWQVAVGHAQRRGLDERAATAELRETLLAWLDGSIPARVAAERILRGEDS